MRAQHRAELGEGDETGGRGTRMKAPKSRFRNTGNAISGFKKAAGTGNTPVQQNKPPARLTPLTESRKTHHLKPLAQEL